MNIVLVPTDLNVILKPIELETKTESGILITHSEKEIKKLTVKAEVIAVGPGSHKDNGIFVEPNVKIGDIVYFNSHVPSEIELAGEKYLITNCYNLLAKESND